MKKALKRPSIYQLSKYATAIKLKTGLATCIEAICWHHSTSKINDIGYKICLIGDDEVKFYLTTEDLSEFYGTCKKLLKDGLEAVK